MNGDEWEYEKKIYDERVRRKDEKKEREREGVISTEQMNEKLICENSISPQSYSRMSQCWKKEKMRGDRRI